MFKDKALILFAKSPLPGQVKTRLLPEYTAQQAAVIHQQLVEYAVSRLARTSSYDFQLHCSPDENHRFFQYLKTIYKVSLQCQAQGDLGERMSQALFNALLEYKKVVLIGSDVPAINAGYIQSAFEALDDNQIVLGPADDGGYVLVGLTQPKPMMFDQINWGSEQVLQQTIDRLSPEYPLLLDTLWDVDRPEDVTRFREMLKPRFS